MKIVVIYGLILGFLLVLLRTLEVLYFTFQISLEIYLTLIAVCFLFIGWLLGRREHLPADGYPQQLQLGNSNNNVLSTREKEVLLLLARGFTNKEIAGHLSVSLNTTKTHLRNIYGKLDVYNRTQAILRAEKMNILVPVRENHPKG